MRSSISHRYMVGSFYCDDCVLWFSDQNTLDKHLQDAEEHASQFACVDCGREFSSRRELEAHVLMGMLCQYGVGEDQPEEDKPGQEGPKFIPSMSSHGSYGNEDTDQTHLHERQTEHTDSPSQYTVGLLHGDVPDPSSGSKTYYHCFGRHCLRMFGSPSALLQHLDSGACPSGINRHIVNSATIALDHSSAITNRLLRAAAGRDIHEVGIDEDEADIATKYRTQATPGRPPLVGQPQLPWGARRLSELPDLCCPLCPRSSKPFQTATALRAHMSSPVHDAQIYHCSSTVKGLTNDSSPKHPSRTFSTLGALAQHLESRGCSMSVPTGAKIFSETMREVQERLQKVDLEGIESGGRVQGLEW